jgi:CRISPR-associated exonuclease Cas4
MIIEYSPEEMLPLSGIQHFLFCRRQWALIHVEQLWQENVLTVDGKILHERADDPFFAENRSGVLLARAVPVASRSLGLSGVCDVVEFTHSQDGVQLPGRKGTWIAAPVEYKRGKKKQEPSDAAQLCAQAICLEEMLALSIPVGYLYYGQTRRRVAVELNADLRAQVRKAAEEMHDYFRRGYTPKVRAFKGCRACSLADLCLPAVQEGKTTASTYLQKHLAEASAQ